jgi:hypothetical protein
VRSHSAMPAASGGQARGSVLVFGSGARSSPQPAATVIAATTIAATRQGGNIRRWYAARRRSPYDVAMSEGKRAPTRRLRIDRLLGAIVVLGGIGFAVYWFALR